MQKNYSFWCWLLGAGLSSLGAHAQADFRPGYLVRPAGDTVRGEIDYRAAGQNSRLCRFRSAGATAATTYQPADLRGYGLPGLTYRSLTLPAPPAAATASPAPAGSERVFVEVLRDGPAQLYFLRDAQGDHYYVQTPSLPLTELRHEFRQVENSGHTFQEEQNGFRQLLAQGLSGCLAIQTRLPRLLYSERSFKQIIDLYNNCVAPGVVPNAPRPPALHAGIGLIGGVQSSQIAFADPYAVEPQQHTASGTGPVFGAEVWVRTQRLSRKLSFRLQALYQSQQYTLTYVPAYHGGLSGEPVQVAVRQSFLRLPVLARYTLLLGPVHGLVEVGGSVAPLLQNTGTYQYVTASGTATTVSLDQYLQAAKSEYTALAGLGIGVPILGGRELAVLVRAEKATTGTSSALVTPSGLRLYGLLSFDLTR